MKKSTIDWAPFIPKEWEEKRIKDIAHLQSGDGITSDDIDEIGLYPVYGGNGLRGYTDTYTNDGSYVLIGRQGALCGNINYAKNKFYASEHAVVVYPYCKEENTTWLGETLRAANLNRLSASAAQPGLAVGALNYVMIPYPPKSQRERIGKYLQEKIPLIDTQVELLEKKKDAYTRLKKAMINRAVTRGLDEHVKLKDSGVEWIGMIPEHWEVKRIKEIGKLKLGKMLDEKPKCGYQLKPYLKSKNIGWLELKLDEVEDMYFSDDEMKVLRLYKGDLVLSEGGEVGKTSYWNDELDECYIQNSVQKLTIDNNNFSRYYLYLSYLMGQMGYYKSIVNLVSIMHLTHEKLRQVAVIRPPLSEQMTIATYLDEKCAKIDAAIANIDKQTDALKRLKRSLINEVISGKRMIE